MSISPNRDDREQDKFVQTTGGNTAVRVSGDPTGTPIPVSGSFAASVSGLTVGGLVTHVALTDAAWTALPATALSGRNNILVQNRSGNAGVILWNYSNSAPATQGIAIEDGGFRSVSITDSILVYGRMLSGTGTAAVEEVA